MKELLSFLVWSKALGLKKFIKQVLREKNHKFSVNHPFLKPSIKPGIASHYSMLEILKCWIRTLMVQTSTINPNVGSLWDVHSISAHPELG